MPAIASLEDLKSAQKEGLSIYPMLSALCSLLFESGGKLGGRTSVNSGLRKEPWSN
jgi:hypothetical protein